MVSGSTRRALIRGGGVAAFAGLAGCTNLFGTEDPAPDAYGVELQNELEESYTVSMRGEEIIEDDLVFEETAEIDPGERREWDEVFADDGTYRLSASVDDPGFGRRSRSDGEDFHIDDDRAPETENILVLLEYVDEDGPAGRTGPQVLVSAWGHPDDYRDGG